MNRAVAEECHVQWLIVFIREYDSKGMLHKGQHTPVNGLCIVLPSGPTSVFRMPILALEGCDLEVAGTAK